jgi:Flp pilus assembly pilin Flp
MTPLTRTEATAVVHQAPVHESRRPRSRGRAGEAGQGMIEYALIGGIVILGAVAVLTVVSQNLGTLFTHISNTLAQY